MKYLTARDGQGSTPHSRERSAQLNGVVRGLYVFGTLRMFGQAVRASRTEPE